MTDNVETEELPLEEILHRALFFSDKLANVGIQSQIDNSHGTETEDVRRIYLASAALAEFGLEFFGADDRDHADSRALSAVLKVKSLAQLGELEGSDEHYIKARQAALVGRKTELDDFQLIELAFFDGLSQARTGKPEGLSCMRTAASLLGEHELKDQIEIDRFCSGEMEATIRALQNKLSSSTEDRDYRDPLKLSANVWQDMFEVWRAHDEGRLLEQYVHVSYEALERVGEVLSVLARDPCVYVLLGNIQGRRSEISHSARNKVAERTFLEKSVMSFEAGVSLAKEHLLVLEDETTREALSSGLFQLAHSLYELSIQDYPGRTRDEQLATCIRSRKLLLEFLRTPVQENNGAYNMQKGSYFMLADICHELAEDLPPGAEKRNLLEEASLHVRRHLDFELRSPGMGFSAEASSDLKGAYRLQEAIEGELRELDLYT